MYTAAEDRYGKMLYRRAGKSGLFNLQAERAVVE